MARDDARNQSPDAGPDSTGRESREAARRDDEARGREQVEAAEKAHEQGDPAAGEVEEWPDNDAETNPVAPGEDLEEIRRRERS